MAGCEQHEDSIEQAICEALLPEEVSAPIRQETQATLAEESEALEKIQTTLRLIWSEERNFFMSFFNIPVSAVAAVARTEEIQQDLREAGYDITVDWVVWPGTLKAIYEWYYGPRISEMPALQQARWAAYVEVGQNYPDWRRYVREQWRVVTLRASSRPQVFNKDYYFWATEWVPENGWYINSELRNKLPATIEAMWVRWFIRQIEWKYVLSVYVDGNLSLASYTSPGNSQRYWPWARTSRWIYSLDRKDDRVPWSLTTMMHYISGWSDSVRNTPNPDGSFDSDFMPMAVGINTWRWEYAHAWYVTWGERSHGCARLPLHYARGLYMIFQRYEQITWDTNY